MIVKNLKNLGSLDAIYFGFHGAAVAEDPYYDSEGEILREVKKYFPDIPFVGTYDFHAIMSEWEVENITPFPYNTNPHIDAYERGAEAAEFLSKLLKKVSTIESIDSLDTKKVQVLKKGVYFVLSYRQLPFIVVV